MGTRPDDGGHERRARLSALFGNTEVGATSVACPLTEAATTPVELSEEVHYFPPRGICVLALERATLKSKAAPQLLTGAKNVLVNSPHPAFAVLHGYFSNHQCTKFQGRKCKEETGLENATLGAASQLINYIKSKNTVWRKAQWIGPKSIDVTIYVCFKNEGRKYADLKRGPKKLPSVIDEADLREYKQRLKAIASMIRQVNRHYPQSLQPWPPPESLETDTQVRVHFTVVPTLEDLDQRYKELVTSCVRTVFVPFLNVSLRRNPDPFDGKVRRAPLDRLELHPVNKSFVKDANEDMQTKIDDYFSHLNHHDVLTGDGGKWSWQTNQALIEQAEDVANDGSGKAVGIMLFVESWTGRAGKGTSNETSIDKRTYEAGDQTKLINLMRLGINKKDTNGKPFRLAVTRWERAGEVLDDDAAISSSD